MNEVLAMVLEIRKGSEPHLRGGTNEHGGWLSVKCEEEGEVEND